MSYNYIVSAKKATAVTKAVVGYFTAPNELNLVLAKINRVHIYTVSAEGLKSVQEIPIFGRVVTIEMFRAKNEKQDSLLILSDKHHLAILGWDATTNTIRTRAAGSIADRVGRISDYGQIVTIHKSGLIAVRIYDATIKIIQWADGKDLKCFNTRLEDPQVVDITFVQSPENELRLCYISHNQYGRHLKMVELNLVDKEMRSICKQDNIENEASMVIPVPQPCGGAIVVGQQTLMYTNDKLEAITASPALMAQMVFNCFCPVDANGSRFLLGDDQGRLYMLVLDMDPVQKVVKDLKVEMLGETSIAECMVYLDNGVLFVGSRFGDSQLIRLVTQPTDGSFVQVLESFVNLAPIRDMALIENEGQTHLVTVSGAFKDGSLRIIRNGIGIEEQATVELPGIKGLFALRVGSETDNYLMVSFADESQVFILNEGELDGTELFDLITTETTLWAGTLGESSIVLQVTPSAIKMCKEGTPSIEWKSPKGRIDRVAVNDKTGQVVVASGNTLFYLTCQEMSFEEQTSKDLDHEVSCVDISSIDESPSSSLVAVGFWESNSTSILMLPSLEPVLKESLPVDMLPRSVLLIKMENTVYLLVALGDGSLFYYVLDTENACLRDLKKTSLGTQPPSLHTFNSHSQKHVFACSDRPAVIFSSNNKLVFSNVNLKLLTQMCSLNSAYYRDCLVMSDGETLCIGTVDDIQKLHIRAVPLGESGSRIAYQKETGTLAVLCTREELTERMSISRMAAAFSSSRVDGEGPRHRAATENYDNEVHSLVILDCNTYEALHAHEFGYNEHAVSLISGRLGDDKTVYYIVGTAIVHTEETEAKAGRIIVFEAGTGDERTRLRKVAEKEVKGCPFSLCILGTKLIAAVNSSIRLFDWTETDKPELRLECSHFNHIAAIAVKVQGDQIVVADIMRSMMIVTYKSMEGIFEEVARDYRCMWMSAVEFIDAETILGSDSSFNLFTGEVDRSQPEEKQKLRMQPSGDYYLGESVNVFRKGSLLGGHVDSQIPVSKPILFGTSDGSIGLVVQLNEEYYSFLSDVEKAVAKETHNCMRVDHGTYRQFQTAKLCSNASGFIDGDLVESVLEWPRSKALEVFHNTKSPSHTASTESSAEDVLKIIEDMSRIH